MKEWPIHFPGTQSRLDEAIARDVQIEAQTLLQAERNQVAIYPKISDITNPYVLGLEEVARNLPGKKRAVVLPWQPPGYFVTSWSYERRPNSAGGKMFYRFNSQLYFDQPRLSYPEIRFYQMGLEIPHPSGS